MKQERTFVDVLTAQLGTALSLIVSITILALFGAGAWWVISTVWGWALR